MSVRRPALGWALLAALGAAAWLVATVQPPPAKGRLICGAWGTRDVGVALLLAWAAAAATAAAVSRRGLFRWLLVTALGLATWGLLELAGAVGAVSWADVFGLQPRAHLGSERLPRTEIRGEAPEELAVLWGLPRPRVPFLYRTDRRGFRNAADRDAADIYCLGDSFLVAGLVAEDATVTARLEAALARPVMALALVGLGPQEQHALLREAAVPLRGRLLLQFVYEGNDLVDSARYRRARAGLEPAPAGMRSLTHCLTLWVQRVTQPTPGEAHRHVGLLGGEPYWFLWDDFSFRGLEAEIEPVLASLGATRDLVVGEGGRYAVVLVPAKLRVLGPLCSWPPDSALADTPAHFSPLPERVRAWAAAHEVPYLDLTEPLRAAAQSGAAPYFQADTHWNARGHEVAAAALVAWDVVARPRRR